MQQTMLPEETRNVRKKRSPVHRWIAGGLSCVMSLCTVLSLVAPAFAQENETAAEPHTHTEACYQQVTDKTVKTLSCDALALAYDGAEGETADFVVHAHSSLCYDDAGALVCTLPEKEAHAHSDGCYAAADTHIHGDSCYDMDADPTCGKTAHTHSDACYTCAREGEEGHTHDETCRTLTCTLEEHTHEAACYPLTCTQSTEPVQLTCTKEEVILHTHDDACYETYTDETGAEQKRLTCTQQEIKEHVHTDACFTTTTEPVDTETLTCTEDHEHTALCYGTWELVCDLEETAAEEAEPAKLHALIYTDGTYKTLSDDTTVITVEGVIPEGAQVRAYPVTVELELEEVEVLCAYDIEIILADGTVFEPAEGEILSVNIQCEEFADADLQVYHVPEEGSPEAMETTVNGNAVSFDTPHFSVFAFASTVTARTSTLSTVNTADTSEFITLNLYDYGTSINKKYEDNKKFPGFQQEYGETSGTQTYLSNFGNNITSDYAAGINGITANAQGINAVKDSANSPISRYSTVMYSTLVNGYPALADSSSLKYLFSANSKYSVTKANDKNITGLFTYDGTTYSYNSRLNHAQFDAETDTFTVYQQRITPNFTMYPFGNFLPFNDITKNAEQVSSINKDYLVEIQERAASKSGAEYSTLATSLNYWIQAMDNVYGKNQWTSSTAISAYFTNQDLNTNRINDTLLDSLYCIDYDIPTDFYFGMEMKMNFMQPKDGKVNGKDMVFSFTGDDDVWVYVDGVLFLDLSGIHRHVAGEIDFAKGEVRYYSLGKNGEASNLYKTVKFSEIANIDKSKLDGGTFKDYSSHSFNFYYMERGSGSSVCSINFNFPLLKQNSISVEKAVEANITVQGDPDYKFQILKADENENKTDELFISGGTSYTIYDANDNQVGTGTTDDNGVFTLKAGQRAEFTGINENQGKYYVRELLTGDEVGQYGTITVSGEATTTSDDIEIGTETFTGVDSPVKDMSEGATLFHFVNNVTVAKLGKLEITKNVQNIDDTTTSDTAFTMVVDLDGTTQEVTVAAGQTVTISNILAGTKYKVTEKTYTAYDVVYTNAEGTISANSTASVAVTVKNTEKSTSVTIPVEKVLTNHDGNKYTFNFAWVEVTDATGETIKGTPTDFTINVNEKGEVSQYSFTKTYGATALTNGTKDYYYKFYEVLPDDGSVSVDQIAHIVKISVTNTDGVMGAKVYIDDFSEGKEVAENAMKVTFTNTLLGSLKITKELAKDSTDVGKAFTMTVTKTDGTPLAEGTAYTVTDKNGTETEKTVGAGGNIELKAGETALIEGLHVGDEYIVEEPEGSRYGYKVIYEPAGQKVTITKGTKVSVKVTNEELKTELEIPVLKKLTNPDGKEHTYAFKLTQVDKDGKVLSGGETQNVSVTMKKGEASAKFVLSYKGTDLNGESARTYYYLVEETTESDLYLDADASTFLLEVKLSGGDNQLTAEVVSVNGQSVSGETPVLTFTNTLLGTITLEKTLVGATHVGPFTFDLKGNIADGDYYAVRNGEDEESVTFKNGKATVKLMLNDTLTIYGIPHGTAITIQEYVGADEVRYTINGSIWKHSGYTAETEVTTSGTTVRYINYYYGNLPQTGQLNWPILLLTVLGVGCLGVGAFLRFRRKKGKYE